MSDYIKRESAKEVLLYNWDESCSYAIEDLERIPAEETYICDLCGEEIEQDAYGTSVVEIVVHDIGGNGWNEWPEKHVYHSHRRCLSTAWDLVERNGGKKYGKIL